MTSPRALRRTASFDALTFLVLGFLTWGVACTKGARPAAGLEVIIASDLRSPQDFDNLEVIISQETRPGVLGAPLMDQARSVPAAVTLPTSVSIAAGSSSDQTARIVIRGRKGNAVVVQRTAQVQIPTDSVLELALSLAADCVNVTCSDTTTCIGGSCASIVVDPSQLQPYQPGDLGGTSPGSDGGTGPTPDGAATGCPVSCAAGYCPVFVGGACGCTPPGSTCPGGGTCSAGVCSGGVGDGGMTGCGQAGQPCCSGAGSGDGCFNGACPAASNTGGCACVSPGDPCGGGSTGGTGTCNAGVCMTGSGVCGPSNCTGCCDGAGHCNPGDTPAACGLGGNYCQICPGSDTCNGGGCMMPPCGQPGQPCCSGGCNAGASCTMGTCAACGQLGDACCGVAPAGNCNGSGVTCGASFTCEACGGSGQACCGTSGGAPGYCNGAGLVCSGGTCGPQCGLAGNACCPYNQCNQGCCENGTCTGQGSTCSLYGGVCANQGCQGNTCGIAGQPCCMTAGGALGCTNGDTYCRNGTCQPCGMQGAFAGANCCPGDTCQAQNAVCSHEPDAGTGGDPAAGYCVSCGGYQQACCKPDAGGGGPGNSLPCQSGYACSSGVCL